MCTHILKSLLAFQWTYGYDKDWRQILHNAQIKYLTDSQTCKLFPTEGKSRSLKQYMKKLNLTLENKKGRSAKARGR